MQTAPLTQPHAPPGAPAGGTLQLGWRRQHVRVAAAGRGRAARRPLAGGGILYRVATPIETRAAQREQLAAL